MGFYVDWVSVVGLSRDEVFERLGLIDAGVATDFPKRGGFMWAVSPEGRVIVVTGRYGLYQPATLAELSAGASVVAARAESNECTSSAWGYEDGKKIWTVEYNDDTHPDVKMRGRIPQAFKEIRGRLLAKHAADEDADVPYLFDGPSDLAAVLGGWAPESLIGDDLEFFTARQIRKPAGDTSKPDRPPKLAIALFGAQLIMAVKLLLIGPGIYYTGSKLDYWTVTVGGLLSGGVLWIFRRGVPETIAGFSAFFCLLLLYAFQLFLLCQSLLLGNAYAPIALPLFVVLAAVAAYEYWRIVRPRKTS